MYTREELGTRIFAPNKEAWIEAAAKDYRSKEEAKVQTVENGILLPLKKIKDSVSGIYAGGVCDKDFKFVAGFRRNLERQSNMSCVESYTVDGGGQNKQMRPLFLAAC